MARQYTLDTKIHALNQLEKYDDNAERIASELTIPASTLKTWRSQESEIRRDYRERSSRQVAHLKSELQLTMMERSRAILERMDDETLNNAPLNQLATALSALVNHALKLEEAIEDNDEQTEEKVIRFEYYYDGKVQDAPPWAGASEGLPRKVQSGGLRETLGQNGTGQNTTHRESNQTPDAWLVADPDLPDVESGLAGFEDELEERRWYHD